MYKLGIIGFGKMGHAIIDGAVKKGLYGKNDILVYDLNPEFVKQEGYTLANSENDVFESSEILFLAIKPQTFLEVIEKLKKSIKTPKLIVSIAAGITLDYLKDNLGNYKYIRVMPNTSVSIAEGASTMAIGYNVLQEETEEVKKIFDSLGSCEIVDEKLINVLLPLNGSYPAYFYYFVRAFINNSLSNGASLEQAKRLIAQASIGCSKMLLETDKNLDQLITDVCSKGGTTIEGINTFNDYDLNKIINEAANNCIRRAKELEK